MRIAIPYAQIHPNACRIRPGQTHIKAHYFLGNEERVLKISRNFPFAHHLKSTWMKRSEIKFAVILALMAIYYPSAGQIGDNNYDFRVKSHLDKLEINYEISGNGNFKVVFDMGEGRSQLVIINSITNQYGNMEVRDILSPIYVADAKSSFSQSMLFDILELNGTYKLGAWQIDGGESPYILQFNIQISANASESVLDDSIRLAASVADEMEKKLTVEDTY